MSNAQDLREKASELEQQASKLREAHQRSLKAKNGTNSGDFGAIIFIGFIILITLNSCS